MKDVGGCEKPRGAANQASILDVRMGKPSAGNTAESCDESIVAGSQPGSPRKGRAVCLALLLDESHGE
jgi:hypothetical protein